jgi:hypothetical protein
MILEDIQKCDTCKHRGLDACRHPYAVCPQNEKGHIFTAKKCLKPCYACIKRLGNCPYDIKVKGKRKREEKEMADVKPSTNPILIQGEKEYNERVAKQ